MALPNQQNCTGSTEPLMSHSDTKIKCAGSFDLLLALNQTKINILDTKR